jgi:methionine-gamma-lyase
MSKKSLFSKKQPSKRTQTIHGAFHTKAWDYSHHIIPPLTASTTFRLESLKRGSKGFTQFGDSAHENPILIYDRLDEPTSMMLEEQLASMESAECAISFGSGMGAISTCVMSFIKTGQKIISHKTLYGCTYSLFTHWMPKIGVSVDFVNLNEVQLEKHFEDKSVRIVYCESVCNPNLEIIDLEKVAKAIKKANLKRSEDNKILLMVDNTFATPWGLRPLEWGADFTIQSLTKNMSGFGTEMGGAIMTSKKHEAILKVGRKDFGAIINPYSAWHIMVYGLPTQALRFEQQQANAQKIARFLDSNKKVETVIYPGLKKFSQSRLAKKYLKSPEGNFAPGTMIAFIVKGKMNNCEKFVDDIAKNSYAITLAVSLGLNKTLIEVPGYMTHSSYAKDKLAESGIEPRLIRLSVGLEAADDIIADLEKGLKRI